MRLLLSTIVAAIVISGSASAHGISNNEINQLDLAQSSVNARPAAGIASARAARAWCGDFAGAPTMQDNQINIIIANPAGTTNRNEQLAQLISRAVTISTGHLAAASQQQKTFRFARNSACPNNPVEIKALDLTTSLADLQALSGAEAAYQVNREINRSYGRQSWGSPYKQLVVINGYAAADAAGYGFIGMGQAVAFIQDPADHSAGGLAYVISHEVLHILGAVNPKAPHGSPGYHCFDESDLMCYNDGTLPQPVINACPAPSGSLPPIDCGNDDYFAADPAPGSFLANHPESNVYNSAYLTSCQADQEICNQGQRPEIGQLTARVKGNGRVTLSAEISSKTSTNYYFEWGGHRGTREQLLDADGDVNTYIVDQEVNQLRPGRQYRWRVVASNQFGQTVADEQLLTMPNRSLKISQLRINKQGKKRLSFSLRSSARGEIVVLLAKQQKKLSVKSGLNRGSIKLPQDLTRAKLVISAAPGYPLLNKQLSKRLLLKN